MTIGQTVVFVGFFAACCLLFAWMTQPKPPVIHLGEGTFDAPTLVNIAKANQGVKFIGTPGKTIIESLAGDGMNMEGAGKCSFSGCTFLSRHSDAEYVDGNVVLLNGTYISRNHRTRESLEREGMMTPEEYTAMGYTLGQEID